MRIANKNCKVDVIWAWLLFSAKCKGVLVMPNAKVDEEGEIALSPQEAEEENPGKFSSFYYGKLSKGSYRTKNGIIGAILKPVI